MPTDPHSGPWTPDRLPELGGRTVVVTGGNGGLGLEVSRELARKGAHVVIACRSLDRAQAAIDALQAANPGAKVEGMELDLASLDSVRRFARDFRTGHRELHVLCNNAGVMALPRRLSAEGFELQLATNHLGHFALTALLLETLLDTPGARVVNVSSAFHRTGRIRFDDLQGEQRYGKWRSYAQSKLANLLFTFELQRRLAARGAETISVAAHPGYAYTNLQLAGPRMEGSSWMERLSRWSNQLFAQSAAMGALPLLYACAAGGVRGGAYYGPDGPAEMRGHPREVEPSRAAQDRETAAQLWQVSEELTGHRFEALAS